LQRYIEISTDIVYTCK